MARFRGTVSGSRKVASRLGTKNSGLTVEAQSWQGKVIVRLETAEDGTDKAYITLEQHSNGQGHRGMVLYDGPVSGMPEVSPAVTALDVEHDWRSGHESEVSHD